MRKSIMYLFSGLMMSVLFMAAESASRKSSTNSLLQDIRRLDKDTSDSLPSIIVDKIMQRIWDKLNQPGVVICGRELNGSYKLVDEIYDVDATVVLNNFALYNLQDPLSKSYSFNPTEQSVLAEFYFGSIESQVNYNLDGKAFGASQNIGGSMTCQTTNVWVSIVVYYAIQDDNTVQLTNFTVDYALFDDITCSLTSSSDNQPANDQVNEFINYYLQNRKDDLKPQIEEKLLNGFNTHLKKVTINDFLQRSYQLIEHRIITDMTLC